MTFYLYIQTREKYYKNDKMQKNNTVTLHEIQIQDRILIKFDWQLYNTAFE